MSTAAHRIEPEHRTFLGQPRQLATLFSVEMWERLDGRHSGADPSGGHLVAGRYRLRVEGVTPEAPGVCSVTLFPRQSLPSNEGTFSQQ